MDTLEEMREAVQNDLVVGSESTLSTPANVNSAINRAYRKSGGLYKWPILKDARKTSTEADDEYYDYPDIWRPESIWKITVDGTDYGDPMDFKDYLYEKENDIPSGKTYMWSNFGKRFYLYPTPTTTGTNNISIFGMKNVVKLTADGDTTIFSYTMPECNEAIVLEAVAILKGKGDEKNSIDFRSAEAKQILTVAWGKIRQEQARYEKTTPIFNVSDMFGKRNTKQITGNF